jgi:hypothetical protein
VQWLSASWRPTDAPDHERSDPSIQGAQVIDFSITLKPIGVPVARSVAVVHRLPWWSRLLHELLKRTPRYSKAASGLTPIPA